MPRKMHSVQTFWMAGVIGGLTAVMSSAGRLRCFSRADITRDEIAVPPTVPQSFFGSRVCRCA